MTKLLRRNSNKIIVLALITGVIVAIYAIMGINTKLITDNTLAETKRMSEVIAEFRSTYTAEVIQNLEGSGVEVTHDYHEKDNAVPLPATLSMIIGKNLSDTAKGNQVRLYSPYPFPHRAKTGGLRDEFGQTAWQSLSENPDEDYIEITKANGKLKVRLASADIMRPACVNCHNNHPQSPKIGWKEGDLRGIVEVEQTTDISLSQMGSKHLLRVLLIIAPFLILSFVLLFIVGKLNSRTLTLEKTLSRLE